MSKTSINVLGVRIDPLTIDELNQKILQRVDQDTGKELVIFKPYVEFLSLAARNKQICELLNKSDINAPDSTALQWAGSYLYGDPPTSSNSLSTLRSLLVNMQIQNWRKQVVPERMAGLDQTLPLLKQANLKKLKVAVLGGPKDILKTKSELQRRFKNLKIQIWSGYFNSSQESEIVKEIANFSPDVLFCAMGFPKQEEFIIRNRSHLGSKVIIGEGGSFDYNQLGGHIKRAPRWLRRIGLEWLWRLLLQPKRIGRQIAIPTFIRKVQNQRRNQK